MSEPCLSCQDVAVGHDGETVMSDVTFSLRPGEIVAVVGSSGCGKSTLLRALAGLAEPLAGKATLLGTDLARAPERERSAALRRIGFLFQSSALWSSLTLRENVELPLSEFTAARPRERRLIAEHRLAQVGLLDAADKLPAEVSGGMAKRAGLARALALDPELLFLDEPTAGLDPVTGANLDDLVLRIRDTLGAAVVLVSHDVPSIERLADFCVYLDRETGRMGAVGKPSDFLATGANPAARAFFTRHRQHA
jgi:phospholipid/cholesterol/gamma-HCH transport system ATP-binding protein